MTTWIDTDSEIEPPKRRPLIAYCPGWNDSYYQVCYWDGKKFAYDEDPNGSFGGHVIKWALFMEAD